MGFSDSVNCWRVVKKGFDHSESTHRFELGNHVTGPIDREKGKIEGLIGNLWMQKNFSYVEVAQERVDDQNKM